MTTLIQPSPLLFLTRPRVAFQALLEQPRGTRLFLLWGVLAVTSGLEGLASYFIVQVIPPAAAVLAAVLRGAAWSSVLVWLYPVLFGWVSRGLGAVTDTRAFRHVAVHASIPQILSSVLVLLAAPNQLGSVAMLPHAGLVWALILTGVGLGVANGTSGWRGFTHVVCAHLILGALVLMVYVPVAVLLAMLP